MKHKSNDSIIVIVREWFIVYGEGINLGYFGRKENHSIAEKLKMDFLNG
ncbi:hypothetical protein [Candidatus Stoquefichus massiliensis]|nr:hypothetical protein [Candidatus Stoquefichus massiliensis]